MNRENYLCFQLQIGEKEDRKVFMFKKSGVSEQRKLFLLKTEYSVIGIILIDVGVYSF
jgi:hypothetical protein